MPSAKRASVRKSAPASAAPKRRAPGPARVALPRIRKILVPLDFSRTSLQVLRCACRYAESFNAGLILVHVNPGVLSPDIEHGLSKQENALLRHKVEEQLVALHRKECKMDLPMIPVVTNGIPHVEIVEAARNHKADLIMLSTHGHTGWAHVMLGSTAERVVRDAPCPVLTFHQQLLGRRGVRLQPAQIQRILVPTDFSKPSRDTVRRAAQYAQHFQASLDLLHVTESLIYPEYPEFGYMDVNHLASQMMATAHKKLEAMRDRFSRPELIREIAVKEGLPFKEITQYAQKNRIDLIVISTHGQSGILNALLGSTAQRVVQHAACAVLVLRQK